MSIVLCQSNDPSSNHPTYRHKISGPVGNHFKKCDIELSIENVSILCSTSRSTFYLMALEALTLNEHKPSFNTKDEYRSRALVIKI